MKTHYDMSTGQGNLFSKIDPKIFDTNTSIISRLHSRSLTGRNPQIKVHIQFGNHIHLIWQTKTNEMVASRKIVDTRITRKIFTLKNSAQNSYLAHQKIYAIAFLTILIFVKRKIKRLRNAHIYTVSHGIGFSNFFLSLSVTMKTNYTKSTGQGNLLQNSIPKFSKTPASFHAYNPGHSQDATHKSKYTNISVIGFIYYGKLKHAM
jgi:hypothetical protein